MDRSKPMKPLLASLLAAALSGCGDREEAGRPGETGRFGTDTMVPGKETAAAVPEEGDTSRILRRELEARLERSYSELEERLDDIWADSLNVRAGMRAQYRRIVEEANTVKDNTKVFLEELRVSSEGVTPEIWERLRSRAELSLDSLRALLQSADTLSDTSGAVR